MDLINRSQPNSVALETTLLVHGVPSADAPALADSLAETVRSAGGDPAVIGIVHGRPVVGMNDTELAALLDADNVAKANTSNLGVLMRRGQHGATTVSATVELAAAAGVRVFSTGAIGGVHRGYAEHLDISSDLAALARFPVAVVSSGVKSLLDVRSTREALETLGVPVVGYQTDSFPAFYRRSSEAGVDARFDDADELADFISFELARTGRGIMVANPIPIADELEEGAWAAWCDRALAEARDQRIDGRGVTPFVLSRLHEISDGRTLTANISLARANAQLGGRLAGLGQ